MSENIIAMTVISSLHEIFTVLWIGGMSVLLLAILPAIRTRIPDKKVRKPIVDAIQKKLSVLAITSMIGLAITGLLMTSRVVTLKGLLDFSAQYTIALSIKHLIGIFMVIIAMIRRFYMDRIFGMKNPNKEKYNVMLLLSNVILGWIVLFLSSYMVKIGYSI
jgi:putative copper export protein